MVEIPAFADATKRAIDDLVIANRILINERILDAFGHVSIRHDLHPDRFIMTRDLAAGLVQLDDIVELDLDGDPIHDRGVKYSAERFIHGEVYKLRPDVRSIVHTHAPALIPYCVTNRRLRPLYHVSAFLEAGAPVYEIRETAGATDMLISDQERGRGMAEALGDKAIVLLRGHGATIVGASLKQAVYRAIYATLNAELQSTAIQLGEVRYLEADEAVLADQLHNRVLDRPWELWKRRALGM